MNYVRYAILLLTVMSMITAQFGYSQDMEASQQYQDTAPDTSPNEVHGPGQVGYPADSNVINVRWKEFGATGNGKTDDTAVIRAALRIHNGSGDGNLELMMT